MSDALHPLAVGSVRLPNNLVLSPMAGYSDLPFRVLARRHGAGLVCTEMVAASSLDAGNHPHRLRMQTLPEERPTSIQLFGTDPDALASAARAAEDSCDVLGFNMGCPAAQIKRQGCGAALLDHPDLAEALVGAIKDASRRPLLVKLRAGNRGRIDVAAFARRMEAAGAAAFIVHARTADQGYSGHADWSLVRMVKERVGVPVIVNGDVVDGPTAKAALESSGADGVALGRAALGDPRIFHRVARFLEAGELLAPPTRQERVTDFQEYLTLAERVGLDTPHILQQAQRFTRGLPGGAEVRRLFQGGTTPLAYVREVFEKLLHPPEPAPTEFLSGAGLGEGLPEGNHVSN